MEKEEDGILWAVSWKIHTRGSDIAGTQLHRSEEQWQAIEATIDRVLEMELPIGSYGEDDVKITYVTMESERTANIRKRNRAVYLLHEMGVTTGKLADTYHVPAYAIRAIISEVSGRSKKSLII